MPGAHRPSRPRRQPAAIVDDHQGRPAFTPLRRAPLCTVVVPVAALRLPLTEHRAFADVHAPVKLLVPLRKMLPPPVLV